MFKILLISIILIIQHSESKKFYDYIIIGGGAAGSVAAVEVAKKYPKSSVLLLERGKSDIDMPSTHSLSAWPELIVTNEGSEMIRYKNGVWTVVGNILSGGSALNAAIMGKETDDFFRKTFNFTDVQIKSLNEIYQTLYDKVGHKTILSEVGKDLINAAEELGLPNTGYQHGYIRQNSTFQTYSAFDMDKNTRNTTADYMRIAMGNGEVPNLIVQVKSYVNRLIFNEHNQVAAVSVSNDGVNEIYYIRGSAILAAGTIKSSQLLQVSGVGDSSELFAAGIPNVIEMKEVGKNFIDRLLESQAQFSPLDKVIPIVPISSLSVEDGLLEERTAGGTVTTSFSIITGALFKPEQRSPTNMALFKVFLENAPLIRKCMNNAIQINILVANPTSRGYIKALTPNIVDDPEIDPNFLATEEDKKASVRASKKTDEYFNTKSLSKYARKGFESFMECGIPVSFPTRVKSERVSSLHIFGGLTYGKVLNNDFTVKGVDNLFVLDGSIFPRATEINPFNTISALGGFIAKEFVKPLDSQPEIPKRVQITNVQEPNKCLAVGTPVYSTNCEELDDASSLWIQLVSDGRYYSDVKENLPYLIRSAKDDRYCLHHIIGGATMHRLCNANDAAQLAFFIPMDDGSFHLRFHLEYDSGPCLMKWFGSNNVSGFSCTFPLENRLRWKIVEIDETKGRLKFMK
jgi:choline dehydrogenase